VAQLRHFKDEFDRLDAQVLLISFGEAHWARAWQQETGAPFPLLLDSTRAVYRAYGLESSFVRVWSPKVMWHYTRRVLAGQKLQSIQGDPHQLGGDFVMDAAGVIRLAHRSRDPVDRPAVETLLAAIKETRPWP
jgi:peroxiredoxin